MSFIEDDEVEVENPCPICGNEMDTSGISCTECAYMERGYVMCYFCDHIYNSFDYSCCPVCQESHNLDD